MKAVRFHEPGDSSVLRYEEVPDPKSTPGTVVVRVRACALNGLDLHARAAGLETDVALPRIPGADIAGEVVELGAGVGGREIGDRVLVNPRFFCRRCEQCLRGEQTGCQDYEVLGWHRDGGYAEHIAVPAENVATIPEALTFTQAAAVPMAFTTANRLLGRAGLKTGETVLVLGASGGVASAVVQLAVLAGARVLATTSAEKVDRVRALGAETVIDDRGEPLTERVREITGGRGVDVLVQTQGGATWAAGLACMARFGRIVVCAAVQGAEPPEDLGTIWWKQLTVVGSTGGTPLDFGRVVALLERGRIAPIVDQVFALEQAAEAQDTFAAHHHVGKVVLEP